jgi:hypothetical protein
LAQGLRGRHHCHGIHRRVLDPAQIWIAVSVYILVTIVKKRLKLSASLYQILQILSLTMFERMPLDQLLAQTVTDDIDADADKQLIPFE